MSEEKNCTEQVTKEEQNKKDGESNDDYFEKVKEKRRPGINGSLVFLYAIFIGVSTIGFININSCLTSRLIPIYLIITGFVGALAKALSKVDNKLVFNITIALVVLYIFCQGLGTYVVYTEYQPNYDPKEENYCNRTVYLVAFWVLTFQYSLLGIFILLSACYMLMRGDFRK